MCAKIKTQDNKKYDTRKKKLFEFMADIVSWFWGMKAQRLTGMKPFVSF